MYMNCLEECLTHNKRSSTIIYHDDDDDAIM